MNITSYKLENDVNDFVRRQFQRLGLKKREDYKEESGFSDYLKEALKGSSKTKTKTNFGKPDFSVEKYKIPVLIENKFGLKKLVQKADGIKDDDKSIGGYAVNGAIHYATSVIASGKYREAIAIGIAGDNDENVKIQVYYVYGYNFSAVKFMENYTCLDFLENETTFDNFYKDCVLTDKEKYQILIKNKKDLEKQAGKLNDLMEAHSITAHQRVLYVSGMLLSMEDIKGVKEGLRPDDLKGIQTETDRDGVKIYNQIKEFLRSKHIPEDKRKLMINSFYVISHDPERDKEKSLDKNVSKLFVGDASVTKQIFMFIYYNIYQAIDVLKGDLDIMGELYSAFLKYALGDGKKLGIVLTPPYITKMMCQILDVNKDSKVMDLATGSAGFLISAMSMMIDDCEKTFGKGTSEANERIKHIKSHQLLGVEYNAEMFALASTNMILRGDGSSNIQKGDTFETPDELYKNFKADRLLLNPPYSKTENGMPFLEYGLARMEKDGLGAIIIQDSAGFGVANKLNQQILKEHTLLASIKMPGDVFLPMAAVQTSIYVFRAHTPHDFDKTVKFIDFRNDGYKRSKRGIKEVDNPTQRYNDIVKIYKAGLKAQVDNSLWGDLNNIYFEDFITDKGDDWNFDQHKEVDTTPCLEDFKKIVGDYLSWEVSNLLKNQSEVPVISSLDDKLKKVNWKEFKIGDLFDVDSWSYGQNKNWNTRFQRQIDNSLPVVSGKTQNNGVVYYTKDVPKDNDIFQDSLTITTRGEYSGSVFYHSNKFLLANNILVMNMPHLSLKQKLFIGSMISNLPYGGYNGYPRKETLKNDKIKLPVKDDGSIDFNFMETTIQELEMEIIQKLEAYLTATGLSDANLN